MCRLTANQGLIKVIDQHSTMDALSSHAPKFVALWSPYEKAMNARKAALIEVSQPRKIPKLSMVLG